MIKKTIITLMVLGSVTSVFAKGGETSNTECNGVGNANSPCTPNINTTGGNNGTTTNNPNFYSTNNNGITNSYSNSIDINDNSTHSLQSNSEAVSRSTADATSSSAAVSNATGGNASSSIVNNNSAGGGAGTTINSTVNTPRQAPPAIAPNMGVAGNNSTSFGISTPFGGVSFGGSGVDGSVRQLNRATADGILVDAMIKVQECNSEECIAFKKYLLKRFK